jgi:hypothetical protein
MSPLTEQQMAGIVQWVQIGQLLVPIIVTGVENLIEIFKSAGVDPAIYAYLQGIIENKQQQADAEAAAHGYPRK